jgi:hypothetical protein
VSEIETTIASFVFWFVQMRGGGGGIIIIIIIIIITTTTTTTVNSFFESPCFAGAANVFLIISAATRPFLFWREQQRSKQGRGTGQGRNAVNISKFSLSVMHLHHAQQRRTMSWQTLMVKLGVRGVTHPLCDNNTKIQYHLLLTYCCAHRPSPGAPMLRRYAATSALLRSLAYSSAVLPLDLLPSALQGR